MPYRTFITLAFLALSGIFHNIQAQSDELPVSSTIILQTTTAWDGSPIFYPEGDAEVTVLIIEIAAGESTGWHQHPVPSFAYILEGELEVTLESGQSKIFTGGSAISEVTNSIHSGQNIGSTTLKLVVFYTGAIGKRLTILEE